MSMSVLHQCMFKKMHLCILHFVIFIVTFLSSGSVLHTKKCITSESQHKLSLPWLMGPSPTFCLVTFSSQISSSGDLGTSATLRSARISGCGVMDQTGCDNGLTLFFNNGSLRIQSSTALPKKCDLSSSWHPKGSDYLKLYHQVS